MELGGAAGDVQDGRDFLGRATFGDELQDLALARREPKQPASERLSAAAATAVDA